MAAVATATDAPDPDVPGRMVLKWTALADRKIRIGAHLSRLRTPDPTEAATNSMATMVAEAPPRRE